VHATNQKSDFLIFYPHRRSINIAAGQSTESEGYGVIMAQIIPNQPPIPLAPVYYCPHATTGTLSPQCLQLYNKCKSPTHKLFQSLTFISPNHQNEISLRTLQHNYLDFIKLPIMHFSSRMTNTPTVATIYTSGLNNQQSYKNQT